LYRFIINLGFRIFRAKKIQTTIAFDRELGLRRSKNESCSKRRNKACGHPKGIRIPKFFQNSII